MKKSIFLFFATLLCASSVWAWNVEQGKVFYFKPSSVWKSDGARFAVAFGSGDNTYAWKSCVAVSGETDVYYVVSPGNYDWMIFCRMKPGTSNEWANKWNESQRVQPNNNYNKFDLKANWATDFNWYKYAPPMKSASITNTSTVYGGDGTQGNPYQIKKGTSISVSATATSTVTADNQTKYYKFYKKENNGSRTSVGNESTTSTCSFTTSSTVGTKYAVDVEARNEYYSNYGTKATSSTLYFITIEPIYAILGSFNDWTHSANTWDLSDQGSNNWKATFYLDNGSHTFKVVHNSSYYGKDNTTITRASATVSTLSTNGANINLTTDIAGTYTFTFNSSDKKLIVEYPPLPKHQVTAIVNPAETGEVTGTGEYKQGSEATLVATPAAGYAFKNWTVGGTEKSTEATYTFTVNEPISLVANFIPEVTKEVTISYLCGDAAIPGHAAQTLAVGVTTPSTITAPSITNYTFNGWTLGTGIQTEDDATDNPIHITAKAEGEYTLTANYTKIELTYTVKVPEGTEKCYIAGEMNSWSFQEMTPTANANEFTITIDGATTAHKYKYTCGESWAYVEKKADGSDLDADRTYNANDVVAKWAEPAKCYLMGIGGDWTTGIEMEEDGDQFKLLCQPIAEGEQFKFKYGDTWTTEVENYDANGVAWVESYPGSGQYNITLPAGNYDFYYKKNENKVWIGVCTPATPETYTRTVVTGEWGTICLPYASSSFTGATFYEVSSLVYGEGLWLDQLADGVQLEAGKPYIFKATDSEIKATYTGEAKAVPEAGAKGLTGTFTDIAAGGLTDNYIIAENKVWVAGSGATLSANRAYIDATKVPKTAQAQLPGRRRVCMGENAATGLDNITNGENTVIKTIENGQLIIIRNGEKFNAQGVRL